MYNKLLNKIINLQLGDGSWGSFHSLSKIRGDSITTEQALKRLYVLGLTKEDEPVKKALTYICDCLEGKKTTPDRREKVINWEYFEELMLSTWLRLFDKNNKRAAKTALFWAEIVSAAFRDGKFDPDVYQAEYRKRIPVLNKGERLISLSQFYMVNILKGILDRETESAFLDYIIDNPSGIYYIYDKRISDLPPVFQSRQASYYIAALEELAGYSLAGEKLKFAVEWLENNRDENGEWDLGPSANDGIYFPLSAPWRAEEQRKSDCTMRIEKLLEKLNR